MTTSETSGQRDVDWTLADLCEAIAEAVPADLAVLQGDRRVSWADFDRRADGVARALLDAGLGRQDKVTQYLYNCPEYLESYLAATKVGLVPVNTNYRYGPEELMYLWRDADAAAVVFHGAFAERIAALRDEVPMVRLWLWVDDGSGPCPEWAVPYEQAAGSAAGRTVAPWGRSGDDLVLIYTGGTTGLPKGVMWRQRSFLGFDRATSEVALDLESLVAERLSIPDRKVALPAAPLMHGTGIGTALQGVLAGGSAVLLAGRSFDAEQLWDTVAQRRVTVVGIVGDVFARPMLAALERQPGRWDLSKLRMIVSAGAMCSEAVKHDLLAHLPSVRVVDRFGSSESGTNVGLSVSVIGAVAPTGAFRPGPGTRVIDEAGRDVPPGSGEVGLVLSAIAGPEGYYKDPDKTRRLFRVVDGHRYIVTGDYATVGVDGTLELRGRGAVCINTGGEKVFPEEVEEALKDHPAVRDVIVVGVPDERFGEAIAAVVELADEVTDTELVANVKARLAGYKAPRHIIRVDSVGRSPNGKADYPRTRQRAIDHLASTEVPA